jgi:hypothetical protein
VILMISLLQRKTVLCALACCNMLYVKMYRLMQRVFIAPSVSQGLYGNIRIFSPWNMLFLLVYNKNACNCATKKKNLNICPSKHQVLHEKKTFSGPLYEKFSRDADLCISRRSLWIISPAKGRIVSNRVQMRHHQWRRINETTKMWEAPQVKKNSDCWRQIIDEKGYRWAKVQYCRHHFGLVSSGSFEARV